MIENVIQQKEHRKIDRPRGFLSGIKDGLFRRPRGAIKQDSVIEEKKPDTAVIKLLKKLSNDFAANRESIVSNLESPWLENMLPTCEKWALIFKNADMRYFVVFLKNKKVVIGDYKAHEKEQRIVVFESGKEPKAQKIDYDSSVPKNGNFNDRVFSGIILSPDEQKKFLEEVSNSRFDKQTTKGLKFKLPQNRKSNYFSNN